MEVPLTLIAIFSDRRLSDAHPNITVILLGRCLANAKSSLIPPWRLTKKFHPLCPDDVNCSTNNANHASSNGLDSDVISSSFAFLPDTAIAPIRTGRQRNTLTYRMRACDEPLRQLVN